MFECSVCGLPGAVPSKGNNTYSHPSCVTLKNYVQNNRYDETQMSGPQLGRLYVGRSPRRIESSHYTWRTVPKVRIPLGKRF